jgi:hypothetical protein
MDTSQQQLPKWVQYHEQTCLVCAQSSPAAAALRQWLQHPATSSQLQTQQATELRIRGPQTSKLFGNDRSCSNLFTYPLASQAVLVSLPDLTCLSGLQSINVSDANITDGDTITDGGTITGINRHSGDQDPESSWQSSSQVCSDSSCTSSRDLSLESSQGGCIGADEQVAAAALLLAAASAVAQAHTTAAMQTPPQIATSVGTGREGNPSASPLCPDPATPGQEAPQSSWNFAGPQATGWPGQLHSLAFERCQLGGHPSIFSTRCFSNLSSNLTSLSLAGSNLHQLQSCRDPNTAHTCMQCDRSNLGRPAGPWLPGYDGKGVRKACQLIAAHLCCLRALDLSDMDFCDAELRELSPVIPQLQELRLQHCQQRSAITLRGVEEYLSCSSCLLSVCVYVPCGDEDRLASWLSQYGDRLQQLQLCNGSAELRCPCR